MRRPLLAVLLASLVVLGATSLATAKDDARAKLTEPLPLGARPGTTISVEWAVRVPDERLGSRPFGAGNMLVRLLSKTGAPTTVGYTDTDRDGINRARVKVPAGGIGGIRVGLRGWSDQRGFGAAIFPLTNDPFLSPGGARCDVGALRTKLTTFVRAYNRGNYKLLDRLFSRDGFAWYYAFGPDRDLRSAKQNRKTLIPYFRARHRSGDRLEITSFRFNGYDRQRELGHFQWEGTRRADDIRDGEWVRTGGKGGLDCSKPVVTIALLLVDGGA